MPSRFSFGEGGYKELVEFDEVIGIHVDIKTNSRIQTSIGEIHYNQIGGYHVVPVDPNKIKRISNKGNKS